MGAVRMGASRALRPLIIALAALMAGSAVAATPSLVVDVDTGRVLHAERATDPWFPASITKLMTTYVVLNMVRAGQAHMDQLLTVSEDAEALPPSKMAFKPGTQVRLDNALKIIMVKSANDIAATIAENLGGSIDGFAAMMNAQAQRLGMHESHFVNPHGLPDERHQTSARDMAILARALLTEFPDDQDLFHIEAIQYGRRVMRNTNGLIGRYPGADGMKTGFICSAGFNVVASATRNGHHLITVILGSPSANERTMKAAELFDRGFNNIDASSNYTLETLPASSASAPPDMRSVICDRRGPMPEEDSQTTLADGPPAPNLLSSPELMAFAGDVKPMRTTLGPRSTVHPVQVWVGLTPPSEADLAAQAAAEDAEQAGKIKKSKAVKTAKAAPTPAIVKSVQKTAGRAKIVLKPVSDAIKAVIPKKNSSAKALAANGNPASKTSSSKGKSKGGADAH